MMTKAGIALVVAFDFRLRERPRHRDITAEVVRMRRAHAADQRLPGANIVANSECVCTIAPQENAWWLEMRRRVRGRAQRPVHHLPRLERHRDDVRWRQLRVSTPLGLMANTPAWRSTTDRLPNVPRTSPLAASSRLARHTDVAEPIDHVLPSFTSLGAGDSRLADRQEPFHHAVEPAGCVVTLPNASWSARYSA